MANLGSPGVEVTVIDESFYNPTAPGTVPCIFVATAQDKTNPSGGIAQGTTKGSVGKVWIITSQRDLTETFGTPLFYTDVGGNSLHGSELNEYGLQAAYSLLSVTSRAYVVRADVDLSQLRGSASVPTGNPVSGTYWVDTDSSLYGVLQWDSTANGGKGSFSRIEPKIIDSDNVDVDADGSLVPKSSFGEKGDYAMVVTPDNENTLYFKRANNTWAVVSDGFDGGKQVTVSPHTSYPDYTTSTGSSAVTGSVWIKTTTPGFGANWNVKLFNGATKTWGTVSAPIYDSTRQALQKLDNAGGGKTLPVGTLFIESNYSHTGTNVTANFKLWRRSAAGATTIISAASTATNGSASTFTVRETLASTSTWGAPKVVSIPGSVSDSVASLVPAAVSAAGFTNVQATYDTVTKKVALSHKLGGDFELLDGTGSPLATLGFTAYNVFDKSGTLNLHDAPEFDGYDFLASNWSPLIYEAKKGTPYTDPADGTLWFHSTLDEVDIMEHDGEKWVGYLNAHPGTDPGGPIVQSIRPVNGDRSDGGPLVDGDIWISTADPDRYGKDIYIWNAGAQEWIEQNVADNSSPDGWVFANARWSIDGEDKDPATIANLLVSNYVDPDAPDPEAYPKGIKLWNLRRSGNTVKKYVKNAIDVNANNGLNLRYENDSMALYFKDRWTCVTPNNADGSGAFGRFAQRKFVVQAFKSMIDTNIDVRDTDTLAFNLIACPGYPETIQNMVKFNEDRSQTAFVVGDTPFRLEANATKLSNWGTNKTGALDNGEDGLVTSDPYLGVFYPSGFTTDNSGNDIVVPPSYMMLRTIITSDAKSYQWFAPAGLRRGTVDNVTSVGYLDKEGEFKKVSLYEGLRDTLRDVKINPIATLPGVGIVNYGQFTRSSVASALDRINVARLVAFLRRQLEILAKPFLFEPNDAQTRREIKGSIESLLIELVGQRALYDFIVVCDTSNNTPTKIDKSELWVDIAVEPVKAVEFIYIPLRIKKTGAIASGQ